MPMFGTVSVAHVTIHVLRNHARAAALALAETELFLPEGDATLADQLPEDPARDYRIRLDSAQTRLEKLLSHYAIAQPTAVAHLRPVEEDELVHLDDWLGDLWAEASQVQERMRQLQEEERRIDSLLTTLENFRHLDVDLGRVQAGTQFLDLRLGTVPSANVSRLGEAASLAGYLLITFLHRAGLSYVAVAGAKGNEATLEGLLRAAGWHGLQVPGEFRDRPERVAEGLHEQRERLQVELARQLAEIARRGRELGPRLQHAAGLVAMAAPFTEVGEGLRSRRELAVISGWVPRADLSRLQLRLRRRLGSPVVIVARPPRRDERVPSLLRHPAWLQPFAVLVKSFGTPRYGEFDPTWLFAVTYVAMFGMMFGDIGHGLVIAGLAVVFRKRLRGFAPFPIAAGLSSTLFGWLYGSIFGFEHLIHPLWISPMTDPVLMLTVALYWGIAFILVVTLLNVYNQLAVGHYAEALFDRKGLAGIVLYAGLINVGYRWMVLGEVGWPSLSLALGAFAVVIAHFWLHSRRPFGERIVTVVIEAFETLMGYLSGTLSFLRVAAFSLNHVALATAVFALAAMMDTTGHWITVVLGNIFIIVLEGAIVAIQTMRLEYYEGFSRFFNGDGREFRPLRLRLAAKGDAGGQ